MKLVRWLQQTLDWSALTSIVSHPLSIFLSRVPILALAVSIFARMAADPNWKRMIGDELAKSIALNTTMLFFGALLIGVGWALWAVRCPRAVRRHPDFETYVSEQVQIGHPDQKPARKALMALMEDSHPQRQDQDWRVGTPQILRSTYTAVQVRKSLATFPADGGLRLRSHAYWLLQNGSNVRSLHLSWLFLVAGSLMSAWPTVVTILRVASWLLKSPGV
jgi:hypothetical protein